MLPRIQQNHSTECAIGITLSLDPCPPSALEATEEPA